jgi:hypothetical protein
MLLVRIEIDDHFHRVRKRVGNYGNARRCEDARGSHVSRRQHVLAQLRTLDHARSRAMRI